MEHSNIFNIQCGRFFGGLPGLRPEVTTFRCALSGPEITFLFFDSDKCFLERFSLKSLDWVEFSGRELGPAAIELVLRDLIRIGISTGGSPACFDGSARSASLFSESEIYIASRGYCSS